MSNLAKGAGNMNKRKICFECGSKDDYQMKKVIRKYEGDDYSFELEVEAAFCKHCGAPIADEEIEKSIRFQANNRIRKLRGIISQEEIIDILNKYNVSQKFLSKLLGWGDITLTRYISGGYTPNAENSKRLKELNNPYVFLMLLNEKVEATNGEIKKELSYTKAYKKVNEELQNLERKHGKIYNVVNWFLSQTTEENPMTHLALQKLLYFTQGWSSVLLNRWMFEDNCEAWVHGAVYRDVYEEFKFFKNKPLPMVNKENSLSNEEREVLEDIRRNYFDIYNAKTLENICHKERPYLIARNGLTEEQSSNEIIKKETIKQYYSEVAEKYSISRENFDGVQEYLYKVLLR